MTSVPSERNLDLLTQWFLPKALYYDWIHNQSWKFVSDQMVWLVCRNMYLLSNYNNIANQVSTFSSIRGNPYNQSVYTLQYSDGHVFLARLRRPVECTSSPSAWAPPMVANQNAPL